MTGDAESGKAKAAGIVGIMIGCIAVINLVCGFIYVALGGPDGSGLYSGFGVSLSTVHFFLLLISIIY